MKNTENNAVYCNVFKNVGFISSTLTEEQLKPLKEEIDEIQSDFTKAESKNYDLVGHLKNQYKLKKSTKHLEKLILPLINVYDGSFPTYLNGFSFLTRGIPFTLSNAWVNFQQKNEFNPPHVHNGVFSFVIYIKIPFSIKDEIKMFPDAKQKLGANFTFVFTNSLGNLIQHYIPVDKTYENTILFFPASMMHYVNPFYSSDDYRISVSGNILLNSN